MNGGTVREMLEELATHRGADGLRHENNLYGKLEDCRCDTGRLCPFMSCPQYDCTFVWNGSETSRKSNR